MWTLQCFACFFKIAFVFALENMKKPTSKVTHNRPQFFFSITNRPKISPNLIYFSIKVAHCATSIYLMTLVETLCSNFISRVIPSMFHITTVLIFLCKELFSKSSVEIKILLQKVLPSNVFSPHSFSVVVFLHYVSFLALCLN